MLRRLLMAAGGSGAFTVFPPTPTAFSLRSAPAGGWSWFGGPVAQHAGDATYVGWIDGSDGHARIVKFDAAGAIVGSAFDLNLSDADDHNNPSILVRASDQRILAFFTGHSITPMYVRISTNPEDVSAFAAKVNLDSQLGGHFYTYPNPVQLLAETDDPIYLFYRDIPEAAEGTETLAFSKSTDGGATWAAQTVLYTPASLTKSYREIVSNGQDRIDFAVTDNHPQTAATSLYHFYYQGGDYYQSDGTLISASLPLTTADLTLVYDGTSERCWVWDIAYEAGTGYPVIAFPTFPSTSHHRYRYARWNGSAWDVTTIVDDAGGPLYGAEVYYSGGIALDHSDPRIVYASVGIGGGRWDIYRYRTTDHGATFSGTALTSSGKNVRPRSVYGHSGEIQVVWMAGTYTSYTDYSVGTVGAGT